MSNPLQPRSWFDSLFRGELIFELLIGLITSVAALGGSAKFLYETPPKIGFAAVLGICALALLIVQICRAFYRNRKARNQARIHSLDGALHLLHAIISDHMGGVTPDTLRICIYAPLNPKNEVAVQVTDYVGADQPYGQGRRMQTKHGIVGKAIRTRESWFASLPDSEHLVDFLVQNYSYSREEAAKMKADRRSWAAIPIHSQGTTIAVLYLDSSVRGAFGRSNSRSRRAIQASIVGVALFLSRSYDS